MKINQLKRVVYGSPSIPPPWLMVAYGDAPRAVKRPINPILFGGARGPPLLSKKEREKNGGKNENGEKKGKRKKKGRKKN